MTLALADGRLRWGRRGLRFLPRTSVIGVGGTIAVAIALIGTVLLLVAPLLLPYDAVDIVSEPLAGASSSHWFGTDDLGRDVFTRTIMGMRLTWFATIPVILSGLIIGGLIGLVAGFGRGLVDSLLMRFTDVTLALPGVLVTLAVAAALGPSLKNTLIAIAVTFWTPYARIVRGEVRRLLTSTHVEAARNAGLGRVAIARRHVLPGLVGPMAVQMSMDVSTVIVTLSSLSFLGLGAAPPTPELGAMTAKGIEFMFVAWWVPVAPAIAVAVLSTIGNFLGDALADAGTRQAGRG